MKAQSMAVRRALFIACAVLLLITAVSKLTAGLGTGVVLGQPDPVFRMPFRTVFVLAAAVEFAVAAICLSKYQPAIKAAAIAWFASALVIYRGGLWWLGYHKPCICMGTLADPLGLTPEVADNIMKIILVFLFSVGYYLFITIFYSSRQGSGVE